MSTHTPQKIWVTPQKLDDRMDAKPFQKAILDCIDKTCNCGYPTEKLGNNSITTFVNRGVNGAVDNPTSTKLLKTRHVRAGYTEFETAYLPDEKAKRLGAKKLRKGDVLLTSTGLGTIGRAALFMSEEKVTVDNHVTIIRTKDTLNGGFLTAFLNSKYGKAWTDFGTTGSTGQLELSKEKITSIRIIIPSIEIQSFVGDLVELSDVCRRQAIEEWNQALSILSDFMNVDLSSEFFSEIREKELDNSYYKAISTGPAISYVSAKKIDDLIGAQFFHPHREKALLVIEKSGATTRKLKELAKRVSDRISAEDLKRNEYQYIGLASIDPKTGFIKNDIADDISGTCGLFRENDILFSKLRPYLNKVAICPKTQKGKCAGSTELVTYRAKEDGEAYYLLFVLKSPLILNQVLKITSGSTHPRIDPELLDETEIPYPDEKIRTSISSKCRSALTLFERSTAFFRQSVSTTEDLIDGKLDIESIMSGKLKAPTWEDIEKELEGI